jgi:hypothetical protein
VPDEALAALKQLGVLLGTLVVKNVSELLVLGELVASSPLRP